ncbi:hypothetical protein Tco_0962616 [Tanacetum coccineum]
MYANNVLFEQFTANLFNSVQPKHSSTYDPSMLRSLSLIKIDKGKSIATPSDDSDMKIIMHLVEQSGSAPNLSHFMHFTVANEPPMTHKKVVQMMEEQKRLANLKDDKKESKKALEKMKLSQLQIKRRSCKNSRLRESVKLHALAAKRNGRYNIQLMKNLATKFKLVKETTEKLDIHPPYQLTQVDLLPSAVRNKKRLRFVIQEMLVIDEPLVDGSERNLILPQGTELPKASEFELASTVQLLRIHNLIVKYSDYANLVNVKLMVLIESRHDVH